jgi:RHS repeat-associated protein
LGPAGLNSPMTCGTEVPRARRPLRPDSAGPLDPERIPLMKVAFRPLAFGLFLSLFAAAVAQARDNQPPDAQADSYTARGTTLVGYFYANDSDPEGGALHDGGIVSPPSNGTLTGADAPDRRWYTPNRGFAGTDAFTYSVCDSQNACSQATVTITVTNRAPFAVADFYVVRGPTNVGPLFQNDKELDNDKMQMGDSVTEQIAEFPQHGILYGTSVNTPDTKSYVPENGFVGRDSFKYNVCDPYGGCSTATVVLYVLSRDGGEDNGPVNCNSSVGEPVNVTNGNVYLQQKDFGLPGVGPRPEITRTYNSNSRRTGLFGRGWSSAYDESVTAYDGTMLRLDSGTGRAVYFSAAGGGQFSPALTDFDGSLTQNGDGTFTLTLKDGEIHRFDAAGKLLSVSDRNANQTVLSYDGNNRLTSITDPFGRVLNVTSDPTFGYVTSLSDAAGTIARYFYGPSLELTRVEYPDGSMYRFGYTYASQGLVLATVKDALYNVLESHTYDGNGRALTSEKHGGVEKYTLTYVSATETGVTDALNRTTKYFFDRSKAHAVVTRVEGPCDCGGGATTRTWAYDDNLRLTSQTNALGQTVSFTHNAAGQVMTVADSAGTLLTNTYDAGGNLLTSKDALNNTTSFTYDGRGQLLSVTDPRNKTTGFGYDSAGNLTSKTDAAGGVTTFTYDGRGRPAGVTDALNQTVSFGYDPAGRLNRITKPGNLVVSVTYDMAGRRTRVTDARNHSTGFAYDEAYRLASVTDADDKTTSYGYDLMSNLTGKTDPSGRTTNFEYDGYNRRVKTIFPPAAAGAPRLEERVEYDAGGHVTKKVDKAGGATSYEYDAAGRVVKVTDPALKGALYEYDARSRLTALTDAQGQRHTFMRDALGRVTQFGRGGMSRSFSYDGAGNRTSQTDFNNAASGYTYDSLNRLTTITYPGGAQASFTYDSLSRLLTATNQSGAVSFAYDALGRVTSTTDVAGIITTYAYDQNGNRERMSVGTAPNVAPAAATATYQYDALNRMTKITDASGAAVVYTYDASGRVTSRTFPNGVVTGYGYDGLGRLTSLADVKGTTTLSNLQYQYDAAGHVTRKTDPAGAHVYSYDAAGRLTSATPPNAPAESYGYDGVGNRTSSHRATGYTYQGFNRLAAAGAASFTYDNNGNLLTKADGAGTWSYAWDYENRLVEVGTPQGVTVAYKYDALGRRVERHPGGGVATAFTYDGGEVVRDRGGDGSVVDYLNGPGVDNKLRQTNAAGPLYYLTDHLRSTVALTDAAGDVVEQVGADSFGDGAGSSLTRYGFTGRERDGLTGLYYYRARWYDPQQGRFLSEDPITFAGGINFYAYVGNDPVGKVDPSGLDALPYYYLAHPPPPPLDENLPISSFFEAGGNAEARYFPPSPQIDPYYGGFRHCVAACLIKRRYGFLAGAIVYIEDQAREDDVTVESAGDKLAEQIGLKCAEKNLSCESGCLRIFPNQ